MKKPTIIFLVTLFILSLVTCLLSCGNFDKKDDNNKLSQYILTFYNEDNEIFYTHAYNFEKGTSPSYKIVFPDKSIYENKDYEVLGWYKDQACTIKVDENTLISGDTAIYGKFVRIHTVTIASNITKSSYPFNFTLRINDGKALASYPKTMPGYNLIGLFTDETCTVSFDISTPISAPITIFAKWNQIALTITYNNLCGAKHINPEIINYETSEIVLMAPTTYNLGYYFDSWVDDSTGKKIEKIPTHQQANISLSAVWSTYKISGDTYWFGYYPQTIKDNSVTIAETISENGYYIGSDGFYYDIATTSNDIIDLVVNPKDSNTRGQQLLPNNTYYFKLEPIAWKMIAYNDKSVMLWSDTILDYRPYATAVYDNNAYFEDSALKYWLNHYFYDKAFCIDAKNNILLKGFRTEKSAYSSDTIPSMCNIAVPDLGPNSYCELSASAISKKGVKTASDYAICLGLGSYYSDLSYWLRSLGTEGNNYCETFSRHNGVISTPVNNGDIDDLACAYFGVAPILWLSLN